MTLNNNDKINRAAKMAKEKAALARTSMQRIEVILTNEFQQDQKLVSGFSAASALIRGVKSVTLGTALYISVEQTSRLHSEGA